MAYDLLPKRFFSFPALPSIWEDEDDWLNMHPNQSGLSVSEDEGKVYIEAAVPGVNPDDVEITYQDNYVWIHGETKTEEQDKKRKYYRQASQAFSYRVAIPGDINPNTEPEATYQNGVMKVVFNKSPKSQPKKIKVKKTEAK